MDRMRYLGRIRLRLVLFPGDAHLVETDDRGVNRSRMCPFTIPVGRSHRGYSRELWPVGPNYARHHCVPDPGVACDVGVAAHLGHPRPGAWSFADVTTRR